MGSDRPERVLHIGPEPVSQELRDALAARGTSVEELVEKVRSAREHHEREGREMAGAIVSMAASFGGSFAPYVQPQCNPFNHFWRQRGRKQVCSVCHEVRGQANTTRRR